jgi:hypothetical protein
LPSVATYALAPQGEGLDAGAGAGAGASALSDRAAAACAKPDDSTSAQSASTASLDAIAGRWAGRRFDRGGFFAGSLRGRGG